MSTTFFHFVEFFGAEEAGDLCHEGGVGLAAGRAEQQVGVAVVLRLGPEQGLRLRQRMQMGQNGAAVQRSTPPTSSSGVPDSAAACAAVRRRARSPKRAA